MKKHENVEANEVVLVLTEIIQRMISENKPLSNQ